MYGKMAVSGLLALALLAFAVPGTAHHNGIDETAYIGPGHVSGVGGAALCQSPPSEIPLPFGLGGACHLDMPSVGGTATITVSDDVFGADNAFAYRCSDDGNIGDGFEVFEGQGTATVQPQDGCAHITVWIQIGVSGTISLA